jgi:hypothetical protein
VNSSGRDAQQSDSALWRPSPGDRVTVRAHVPGWAGQSGSVKTVGAGSLGRPVRVILDDLDERDFAVGELAPAPTP